MKKRFLFPLLAVLGYCWYGYANANTVVKTKYTIRNPRIKSCKRILFISDIHYGHVQCKTAVESMLRNVRKANPDMLIIGGDMIHSDTSYEDACDIVRMLAGVPTRDGKFFLGGNHDYQTSDNAEVPKWKLNRLLKHYGIKLLDECEYTVDYMTIYGRSDYDGEFACNRNRVPDDKPNMFKLVVDHQPVEYKACQAWDVDLLLCGHTHAGQIKPVGFGMKRLGKLVYGRYVYRGMDIIVSSGAGVGGVPFRTEKHCEYVVVDLVPLCASKVDVL